jgi:hypothetical protein
MKLIRETDSYALWEYELQHNKVYHIEQRLSFTISKPFTKEVADSLSSMDSSIFDAECTELMKVSDFHIEREFNNAD